MLAEKMFSRRKFIKNSAAVTAAFGSSVIFPESSKAEKTSYERGYTDKIKIAAVQMNAMRENLEYNLEVHRRISREAAADGCNIILFPELSVTAHYGHVSATSLAEEATVGRIYKTMQGLAKELNVFIAYGFCEILHGAHYNSEAIVGPEGLMGIHRKVHASRDEYIYFRMGRALEVFDIGLCRIGILICYDANFFEAWRVLALKNADILLLPHASRSAPGEEVPKDRQIRQLKETVENMPGNFGVYAADNNVFAVYANQADYNGHSTHSGGAYVCGPDGKVIVKSKPVLADHWISADVDLKVRAKGRAGTNSLMKDRRPEVYGELTKMI